MEKKKVKGSRKKVIGELMQELNDELSFEVGKLEETLAEEMKKFTIETGFFVDKIIIDDEGDYEFGDNKINLKVEVVLGKLQ